ncbi:MAG: type I restriction endonuclease subunit R [Alphaproteobacteria bacterium]|nr:type I restriction endonuclease subunit R [Alphaproteobacteria bacterium]
MSEYASVERPFLETLSSLGWRVIDHGEGIPSDPTVSLRSSFSDVALRDVFREAVRRINVLDDGRTWLTDAQLDGLLVRVVGRGDGGLVEANERTHRLLRGEVRLQEPCDLLEGRELPITLIDFTHPERNSFVAINQFRIDPPGSGEPIRPDIVLFVNGLPLVVVECKDLDPNTSSPIYDAVEDLRVYANRRSEQGGTYVEGDERLFVTNLFVVATCGTDARAGSFTGEVTHYYSWRDVSYPKEIAADARVVPPLPDGIEQERDQERLVRGMLHRYVVLDLLRHFTVFMDAGKHRVKVLARYQQYRAVEGILARLRRPGESVERSGVVWHTQGSGKSLTMVFAIRKLRTQEDLKDHRMVLVNDRRDLERQLTETARLSGETPHVITKISQLERLRRHASDVVLVMVHKFQEERTTGVLDGLLAAEGPGPTYGADEDGEVAGGAFPTLSDSARIVVMIDEAHRTQSSANDEERATLGDNLVQAFPNAARIAFTGTPLRAKKYEKKGTRTIDRFGGYIDKYLFQQSIADRATLPITYIGRTVNVELAKGAELDQSLLDEARLRAERELANDGKAFPDLIAARTDAQIERIKRLYGTSTDIFEADARIADVAKEIVNHYVQEVLPNGFKAQVVCSSQLAAARYKKHLDKVLDLKRSELAAAPDTAPILLARLAMLRTAVVLSDADKQTLKEVKEARQATTAEIGTVKDCIDWFKADFEDDKPKSGLGIVIVCDMLLTGFDAPIEQVMYLDKVLKEHNLLQTIARVNRVRSGKDCGYIVDFVGLMSHLEQAFEIYGEDRKDLDGVVESLDKELARLDEHEEKLIAFFEARDHETLREFIAGTLEEGSHRPCVEEAVGLLKEPKVRAEFEVLFEDFLRSLNICYALKAARAHVPAAQRFGEIQRTAREVYRDRSLDVRWAAAKIRSLVNTHLKSKGVDPDEAELPLTDPDFLEKLKAKRGTKTAAAEMEHAMRVQIKMNLMKDPGLFKEISRKLEQVLARQREAWKVIKARAEAQGQPPSEEDLLRGVLEDLEALRQELVDPTVGAVEGLTNVEAAFWRALVDVAFGGLEPTSSDASKDLARTVVGELRQDLVLNGYWSHPDAVRETRGKLKRALLRSGDPTIKAAREAIVDAVMELAKVRHSELVAPGG